MGSMGVCLYIHTCTVVYLSTVRSRLQEWLRPCPCSDIAHTKRDPRVPRGTQYSTSVHNTIRSFLKRLYHQDPIVQVCIQYNKISSKGLYPRDPIVYVYIQYNEITSKAHVSPKFPRGTQQYTSIYNTVRSLLKRLCPQRGRLFKRRLKCVLYVF